MSDQSSRTLESMSQATWYNNWVKNKFSKYLTGKILEVGCGIGNFSSYLSKYGELTAMDIDKDYIEEAKQQVSGTTKVGLGNIEKGEYFFKKETFNTVVCLNVLEHIENDQQALENIHDLLATNGLLILIVPSHKFLYNLIDRSIGHYRRYQKEEIENMLKENNFEIVKIRNLNFLGFFGWFIAGKLFKDEHVSGNKIKIFNFFAPIFLVLENIFESPIGTSILVIARKKDQ